MACIRILRLALIALATAGLAACAFTTADVVSTPSGPSPSPDTTSRATPQFEARLVDLDLIPGDQVGDWTVLGELENALAVPLRLGRLRLQVLDARGEVLAEQDGEPPIHRMAPGERAPFLIRLYDLPEASAVEVAAPASIAADFERAAVEISALTSWPRPDGGWWIVGTVANPTRRAIEIEGLALLAREARGHAADLAVGQTYLTYLAPQQSSLLVAVRDGEEPLSDFTPYIDASIADPIAEPSIVVSGDLRLLHDRHGNPQVLGAITNAGPAPSWARLVILLEDSSGPISALTLAPPLPLAAGESLGFLLEGFPGVQAGEGPLEARVLVDPRGCQPSDARTAPLEVQVTYFEGLGERLFLRGTIHNPWAFAASQPTVMADVRATDGDLITAGWIVVDERLDPGETLSFVLALPLSGDSPPGMNEYDIRGMGLRP